MKAAFYEGSKSFRVGEADVQPPGPGEARVDVAYCGICGTEIPIFHGAMDKRVQIPQ